MTSVKFANMLFMFTWFKNGENLQTISSLSDAIGYCNSRVFIGLAIMVSRELEIVGAYHLATKSGNFGLKWNGKVILRKFRSEIVDYLQRYSSFFVRNGTADISLPFAKLSSFQTLISRKQLREIEVQMVSAISFGWFADFGKTLTITQGALTFVWNMNKRSN